MFTLRCHILIKRKIVLVYLEMHIFSPTCRMYISITLVYLRKIRIMFTVLFTKSVLLVFIIKLTILVSQESKCGRPLGSHFTMPSTRIVNGYDVGYYRYPWYAAFIEQKQVTCGGALISPKLVITAAHCYKEHLSNNSAIKLESIYTVRLGMYNICTTESTVTEFKIDKVKVHEMYLTKQPYYDICLVTLANETNAYEPLCLPSGVINPRPKEGLVPGMGTLKYEGAMPCTLHEARLLIYTDSECLKMINSTGNNASDVTKVFCAGYLAGGIDTCQGDSGGPLQILDQEGRQVLIGLVSFGFHCAMPNYLGVYTDVTQYISWIKANAQTDIDFISSVSNQSSKEDTDLEDPNAHKKKKKKKPHTHHEHNNPTPIRVIILRSNGKQRKGRHYSHNHNN